MNGVELPGYVERSLGLLNKAIEENRQLSLEETQAILLGTHQTFEQSIVFKKKACELNSMVDSLQGEVSLLRKELESRGLLMSSILKGAKLRKMALSKSLLQLEESRISEASQRIHLLKEEARLEEFEGKLEASRNSNEKLQLKIAEYSLERKKTTDPVLKEAQIVDVCPLKHHSELETEFMKQGKNLTQYKQLITSLEAEVELYQELKKEEAAKKTALSPYTTTMLETWIKEVQRDGVKKGRVPHINLEQWVDLLEISATQAEERLRHIDRIRGLERIREQRDELLKSLAETRVDIAQAKSLKEAYSEEIEANALLMKNSEEKVRKLQMQLSEMNGYFDESEMARMKLENEHEELLGQHERCRQQVESTKNSRLGDIEKLELNISEYLTRITALENENGSLRFENSVLKESNENAKDELAMYEMENKELRSKLIELNVETESTFELTKDEPVTPELIRKGLLMLTNVYARETMSSVCRFEKLQDEKSKLEEEIRELIEQHEEDEKELNAAIDELEKVNGKFKSKEKRCNELSKELTQVIQQMKTSESMFDARLMNEWKGRVEYEELNERLYQDLKREARELQRERARREEQLERYQDLEKQLEKARKTVISFTSGNDVVEVTKAHYEDELRMRVRLFESRFDQKLKEKLARHSEIEKNLRRRFAIESHERHKMQEKNKFLESKIQRMSARNIQLDEENEELQNQTRELVLELDLQTSKVSDLERIVRNQEMLERSGVGIYEANITSLETRNNTLTNTVRSLKEEIATLNVIYNEGAKERLSLEERCRDLQLQCVEARRHLGEVRKFSSKIELERKRREMLERGKRMIGEDLLSTKRRLESLAISLRKLMRSQGKGDGVDGQLLRNISRELKMLDRPLPSEEREGLPSSTSNTTEGEVKGILRSSEAGPMARRKYSLDNVGEQSNGRRIQEIMHRRLSVNETSKRVTFKEMQKSPSFS